MENMRRGLTLKVQHQNELKNASTEQQKVEFGGENPAKLSRQIGRSNLRATIDENMKPQNDWNSMICDDENETNFQVYVDPSPKKDDNNMLHELERKLEQKLQAEAQAAAAQVEQENQSRFVIPRQQSEIPSICDETSAAPSICGVDDEDFDRFSTSSSTVTTVIRAELKAIHLKKDGYNDTKQETEYSKMKAIREKRENAMMQCDEYYSDMFRYMSDRQTKTRGSSKYMSKQAELTVEMRAILIDWFNDVSNEYGLQSETLHLAVALVDRVLSLFCVEKHRLQLVGTTALMIAAKYEEIYPPELNDFVVITDKTYRADQILMMERYLLTQLSFNVATPTSLWFAASFAKRLNSKQKTRDIMHYMIDLALLEYEFLRFRPSHIAAAALCFANVMTDEEAWPQSVVDETGINLSGFAVILPFMHKAFRDAKDSEYKSIYEKYSGSHYNSVSLMAPPAKRYVVATETIRTLCPKLFEEYHKDNTGTTEGYGGYDGTTTTSSST